MPEPKAPITLTPRAVAHVKRLINGQNAALRVGLKKGGCAGMEYTMEIVEAEQGFDLPISQDGVKILVAPTAQMFLIGMEIDYEDGILESGFRFRNPNVAESCGCGESVSFSIDELRERMDAPA